MIIEPKPHLAQLLFCSKFKSFANPTSTDPEPPLPEKRRQVSELPVRVQQG